jgi:hypothetical protein
MSVAPDTSTVHHPKITQRSILATAAEWVIVDYLRTPTHRQGVTLKTLCFNVLPANRSLLLKGIEALARRGLIRLQPSAGDILVRLVGEVRS